MPSPKRPAGPATTPLPQSPPKPSTKPHRTGPVPGFKPRPRGK